jgi:hypothetical protein
MEGSVPVKCSCCGHVLNRTDLQPGDLIHCKGWIVVPVEAVTR